VYLRRLTWFKINGDVGKTSIRRKCYGCRRLNIQIYDDLIYKGELRKENNGFRRYNWSKNARRNNKRKK
jgi:hypothetical protein